MASITVVGGFGVGLTMLTPRMPDLGETISGGEFLLGPGGKASNQAVAARRLGATAELFTCIGSDDFGAIGQALWHREGVGTTAVKVGNRPTMAGVILVEPTGENRIVIAPGALDELAPEDTDALDPVLRSADICLVSLEIPTPVAVAALQRAKAAGVTTVLDPAPAPCRGQRSIRWDLVDVITPNRVEAAALTGSGAEDDADALLDRLRAFFDGLIVLTLGAEGAVVDDGRGCTHIRAPQPTRVADTTGAGDAFAAALAVALADGRPSAEAAQYAAAAGSLAVTIPEVIPALPTSDEVDAVLARLPEVTFQ